MIIYTSCHEHGTQTKETVWKEARTTKKVRREETNTSLTSETVCDKVLKVASSDGSEMNLEN